MADTSAPQDRDSLFQAARQRAVQVLLRNSYEVRLNGTRYRHTLPSREFYVHQWNWDSATHAMGLIHVDPALAYDEIRSLLSGQWENGLISQITFNPEETKYFPGPEFWGTEQFRRGEIITSGITQPPILAIAVHYVYQASPDREAARAFLAEVLPSLERYHTYLKQYRDPEDSGLVTVIHPWETGCDNSPRWDKPLQAIDLERIPKEIKNIVDTHRSDVKHGKPAHRPGIEDYYRYMYLVQLFSEQDWDVREIVKTSPFAVKDILFNAIWCRSNEVLAETLEMVARSEDGQRYRAWAAQTRAALASTWDDAVGLYCDIDVARRRHEPIRENTVATFVPLWAGVPTGDRLARLLERLADPEQYWSAYPVPTVALDSPRFDPARYWRGPTWPITNLCVIEGLDLNARDATCSTLRSALVEKALATIAEHGFFEYYDPIRGSVPTDSGKRGLGFGGFSWSASIFIYLLSRYAARPGD